MQIIFFLILVSLVLAGGFLGAYLWAAKTGQFDDDCTPAIRMLFDDAPVSQNTGATSEGDEN